MQTIQADYIHGALCLCAGNRNWWGKDRCHQKLAHPHHCYQSLKFYWVHEILPLVHPQVHTGNPTPAWTDIYWICRQEEGYGHFEWQVLAIFWWAEVPVHHSAYSCLNCILMLTGLVWVLSSIRLMTMGPVLPSPTPVGAWQRLKPTTNP